MTPWRYDLPGRERFRSANGLAEKFVVMYSGNHSPCHSLDTLLERRQQARRSGTTSLFVLSAAAASMRR